MDRAIAADQLNGELQVRLQQQTRELAAAQKEIVGLHTMAVATNAAMQEAVSKLTMATEKQVEAHRARYELTWELNGLQA